MHNNLDINNLSSYSKIQTYKLHAFDGAEYKTAFFFNKSFPIHLHKEWSLAFIKSGSEIIQFGALKIQLHAGSMILIPPYSPHANQGHTGAPWKYRALYISEESVRYIFRATGIDYEYVSSIAYFLSYDKLLVQEFSKIIENQYFGSQFEKVVADVFIKMVENSYSAPLSLKQSVNLDLQINELTAYIHENLNSKITLDRVSEKFKMNKYQLHRKFKIRMGITLQDYVTSLRIELAKKMCFRDIAITTISTSTGFYDQSHFSHNFKKYVGLTPTEYQAVCNILQDKATTLT